MPVKKVSTLASDVIYEVIMTKFRVLMEPFWNLKISIIIRVLIFTCVSRGYYNIILTEQLFSGSKSHVWMTVYPFTIHSTVQCAL